VTERSSSWERESLRISAIIPFFNEEEHARAALTKTANALTSLGTDWEIVAVDDGSLDKTYRLLRQMALTMGPRIKLARHTRNRGPGQAFATGFRLAKGDIIVTLDADLSYHPSQLALLLSKIDAFDIVLGSPFLPRAKTDNSVRPERLLMSKLATLWYSILCGKRLSCYTSFFRAYRSHVVKSLRSEFAGFESQVEILARSIKLGFTITEVPVRYHASPTHVSKFRLAPEVSHHIRLSAYILARRLNLKNY